MNPRAGTLLLVGALVISACSPASSASPVVTASPEPSPTILPTPSPFQSIPHFTQPPHAPTCTELGFVLPPGVIPPAASGLFGTGRRAIVDLDFELLDVVDRADPTQSWTRDPENSRRDESFGYVIGGREVPLRIFISENGLGNELPFEITSIAARLHVTGGPSRDLDVRIDEGPDGAPLPMVRLPDTEATGSVDIDLAWQNECLSYRAAATASVRVVSRATVDACPREGEFSPYLDTVTDPDPEVSGVPIRMLALSAFWTWGDGNFAVDGPLFEAFDPEAPVVTGPAEATVFIASRNADLAFSAAYPSFYRRSDVVGWGPDMDTPESVVERRAREQPDGTFAMRLPANPGRYVAITFFGWHSPCAIGQSAAIFAVDVE